MNTNSRSDQVWDLLHGAEALIKTRGFVATHPPLPAVRQGRDVPAASSVPYAELVERYRDRLALGSTWPEGTGSSSPLALIVSAAPLSPDEREFVRTWFENPRVNYKLEEHFWFQSLPTFAGEEPPFRELFEGLCAFFQPRAVFCLGPEPARRLLGAPLSVDTLRTGDFRLSTWPLLTTLDPSDYAKLPEDPPETRQKFKAQVWKDLQRLVGKLKYA